MDESRRDRPEREPRARPLIPLKSVRGYRPDPDAVRIAVGLPPENRGGRDHGR